ncbi:hypothetical protein [Paenarthrobacter nicotinovorans]|uniref:hypothetical protein n=1 Tax=Paenarthrobacter nicotinovorans TaxID=29320 RepID=UPI0009D299B0|nr:hypothetical protein [Paenarthrobacter nicotinovorans]MDI2020896.1 hypothetical protein [Paenarthrobacter nicotinovorans]SKC02780.1 hypothetical protein SAMN05660916_03972 [Arthrobacter sp. 31Cvi3.1E]
MGNELQPQTNEPDTGALPDVLTSELHAVPDGATRFRRYCLGFIDLMFGLFTAWIAVVNTVQIDGLLLDYQATGTQIPAGWIASFVAVTVGFSVLSITGLFIGIWNLRGLRTMSPGPLAAAIVYSLMSIAMMAVFLNEYGATLSLVLVHVLIVFMTVRILRHEGVKSLKEVRRRFA